MKPKTCLESALSSTERTFHDSFRPSWTLDGTLVYAMPTLASRSGKSIHTDGILLDRQAIASEGKDIRFAGFIYSDDVRLVNC